MYPISFRNLDTVDLQSFTKKYLSISLSVATESHFKDLLKATTRAGKIILNNRQDLSADLRLCDALKFPRSNPENAQAIAKLENGYKKTIDFLLSKVRLPEKTKETPFGFDWFHFAVTLPILYSQAMIMYENSFLAQEILGLVPEPNMSLGYVRELSNAAQMGIPHIIAKCYIQMKPTKSIHNVRPPLYEVNKVIPPNVIELFSPCGPNSSSEQIKACTPYAMNFIRNTDEHIIKLLVEFYYSKVFSENMRLNVINVTSNFTPAHTVKDNKNGLDTQGGFIFHQDLRSYNYFLVLLNSCLFYQILYNAKTCDIQTNLGWVPKVLHFYHKFVHPSIVTRFGSFTEFNKEIEAFVDIFNNNALDQYMSTDTRTIANLYQNPDLQKTGIYVFRRAGFVSAIFKEWSIQLMLPVRSLAFGEVDNINTEIVHQSALSKIMLTPSILEGANRLIKGDYGYPGTLWLLPSVHNPGRATTLTLHYNNCVSNKYACFDAKGGPLSKADSYSEDSIFVSFARCRIRKFYLEYTEFVVITKYGIIVGYFNIKCPSTLGNDFTCCIHRWPGIHSEYLVFPNNNNGKALQRLALKKSNYSEINIEPINIPVTENIIYTNINNVNENILVGLTSELYEGADIPVLQIAMNFPNKDKKYTPPIKAKIDGLRVYINDIEIV